MRKKLAMACLHVLSHYLVVEIEEDQDKP